MTALLAALWWGAHALLAIPVAWLACQLLAARMPPARVVTFAPGERGRVAVLVPAHDEGSGISATVATIRQQLQPGDRVLVVADNCSDDTAAVARDHGAEVTERHDTQRRGKGYALDHGVRHLATDAPDWVLVCDADCQLAPGSIEPLVATSRATGRPVQSLDLMLSHPGAGVQQSFSEFAWRVKNQARALGSLRLGAPCQLMGTGMLFPWRALQTITIASGHIVEDMRMGVDLALAELPPYFEPRALVTSRFPETAAAAQAQRARWEHGHMGTMAKAGPQLIAAGLMRGRPALAAMGVDMLVPPLALLGLALMALVTADALLALIVSWRAPLLASLSLLTLFLCGIVTAWGRFGAGTVTGREMLAAVGYAARKLPLYAAFLVRRQTEWVRAKRDGD